MPVGYVKFVAGNSFECDIVIRDSLIESRHLELNIEPERCFIRPIAGKTLVNQSPVEEEECELDYYQPLMLGSTRLMLGPVDEPWVLPQEDAIPVVAPREKSRPDEKQSNVQSKKPRPNLKGAKVIGLIVALSGCVGLLVWAIFNLSGPEVNLNEPAASKNSQSDQTQTELRKLAFAK